ncbi:MAG: 4Fe-4S dicluster domain-containing protein, partial [Bacteroidales bacterium]
MKERFIFGFDFFVLPFTVGMVFALLYLSVGAVKIIISLTPKERKKFFISLLPPKIFGTIWEIIRDVLLHLKIFKKNLLLGYMHASIAFGWFLLIVIGHIEVFLYTPHRGGVLYYPIFFRYFVAEVNHTLKGAFLFFLMDFFLLIVLSGVALAIFKRFKSKRLGMVRTTRHPLGDRVALYSLWAIFPLRLLAESFTAEISGGSFLTKSLNSMLAGIPFYNNMMELSWWLYSIALALFFFTLPLSRYMHIPTEILLILLRRAGITSQTSRGGFAEAQIYSCSSCGLCIDGCPLCSAEGKEPFTAVYFIRKLRRGSPDTPLFAQECLLCGKCTQLCPVEIDSSRLRLLKKREESPLPTGRYSYLREAPNNNMREGGSDKVLYYSGCMGHLTPSIYKSLLNIL